MVIFHSYVSLPEGNISRNKQKMGGGNNSPQPHGRIPGGEIQELETSRWVPLVICGSGFEA